MREIFGIFQGLTVCSTAALFLVGCLIQTTTKQGFLFAWCLEKVLSTYSPKMLVEFHGDESQ